MSISHAERQKEWIKNNPWCTKQWKKENPTYHYQYLKEWSKTCTGCLSYIYSRMKRRVKSFKYHKGLSIISRKDFYAWAESRDDYKQLFQKWVLSNYDKRLSPSIDRIDSSKEYTVDNMNFLTTHENRLDGCKAANKARWRKA